MKRVILISMILWISFLSASPVEDLSPDIYELQIIDANNWNIEINLFEEESFQIDNFIIKNKSDSAVVVNYALHDSVSWGSVMVVTQNDLSKPLSFDKDNDIISLCYSLDSIKYTKSVMIGDYPGSLIHNLEPDQSVCWDGFWKERYKSSPPTIGAENTFGYTHVYGKVFVVNNVPITNSTILFYPLYNMAYKQAYIDENGVYHTYFTSHSWGFSSLTIRHDNGFVQNWDINDVTVDLEPNDSIEVNFYSTMTSITPVIKNDLITLNNYPQPASSYTWVNIDNTDVDASAMRVNVYALNGRKVDSFIPSAKHFRYDCGHLPQGSYVLSLQYGHEVLASKKLQILK